MSERIASLYFEGIGSIDELISDKSYEEALGDIHNTCFNLVNDKELRLRYNALPQLDQCTQEIGNLILGDANIAFSSNRNESINLFIVTELYELGGHSRVLEDILNFSNKESVIVITDLYHRYATSKLSLKNIQPRLVNSKILILRPDSLCNKAVEIFNIISQFRPKSITLLAHNQDVVAYAACNFSIPFPQIYIHHADHTPTLGSTIKHYVHVDLHPAGLALCKKNNYVKPQYFPLSKMPRFKREFSSKFSTATSGTFNKFSTDGPVAYHKIVKTILQSISGLHYHIGPIPADYLHKIYNVLDLCGLDKSRFVNVDCVDDISKYILDHQVDVYITSAPIDGLKAYVDVLSLGICVLKFENKAVTSGAIESFINNYAYSPAHQRWTNLTELDSLLKSIDLNVQFDISREWFEKKYNMIDFLEFVELNY